MSNRGWNRPFSKKWNGPTVSIWNNHIVLLKHWDCFLSGDDRCFVYCFVLRRLIFSVYSDPEFIAQISFLWILPMCLCYKCDPYLVQWVYTNAHGSRSKLDLLIGGSMYLACFLSSHNRTEHKHSINASKHDFLKKAVPWKYLWE